MAATLSYIDKAKAEAADLLSITRSEVLVSKMSDKFLIGNGYYYSGAAYFVEGQPVGMGATVSVALADLRAKVTCESCGKTYRWGNGDNENVGLCPDCYDEAGLENAHADGHHDAAPDSTCPKCREAAGGPLPIAEPAPVVSTPAPADEQCSCNACVAYHRIERTAAGRKAAATRLRQLRKERRAYRERVSRATALAVIDTNIRKTHGCLMRLTASAISDAVDTAQRVYAALLRDNASDFMLEDAAREVAIRKLMLRAIVSNPNLRFHKEG